MKAFREVPAICTLLLFAAASNCMATTWYVSTSGLDTNSGSSSSPFASLYKAVSVVQAGDTIDVNAGTYMLENEATGNGYPVNVTTSGTSSSPIIIQSTPGQSAIIDGTGLWNGLTDAIDLSANYITVQNMTVQNAPGYNIDILTGNNDTISNCVATGGVWGGIIIGGPNATVQMTNDTIKGCTIHDNVQTNNGGSGPYGWGSAVDCSNCSGCTIQNNVVYHNWGEGIDCYPNDYPADDTGGTTSNILVKGNTVYDNFSVEIYIDNAQYIDVENNMIYADANACLRSGEPGCSIQVDNEMASPVPPSANGLIVNNITVGGEYGFAFENGNTWSGFYPGGLNGFGIYNNVFYNGNYGSVYIDDDSGNNFTWENNITWQTSNSEPINTDNGGGTQVLKTNCWDGKGNNSMAGTGDVDLSNTNPGFASAGSTSPSGYVLSSSSPCYTTGTNKYSVFTFDFNGTTRPSSGAWTMGAFAATSTKTSTTTTLTSSLNPSTSGQSVTFTATVSPTVPSGETVTFYNGSSELGTGTTSSSKATYSTSSLPVGSDSITATYAGDATYASSTSSVLTQTVNSSGGWSGIYRFINRNNGFSLSVNSSKTNGATIVEETDKAGTTSEEWDIVTDSNGYYRFINEYSGLALDVNGSTTSGTDLVQYTSTAGRSSQEWTIVSSNDGTGYYDLVNVLSGMVANTNNSSKTGTAVIQYAKDAGYWDEEFTLTAD